MSLYHVGVYSDKQLLGRCKFSSFQMYLLIEKNFAVNCLVFSYSALSSAVKFSVIL